ncbi:MAG: FecR domain-containing protein [Candidatus Symbiothrix sp.]|nr:FecR domain-containing protein [Candidatus Symbiothrix sp.]
MNTKIIDKVLSKNASPEEARQVAAWFATDEGQEYFSQRYDRESYLLNERILAEWSDHEIPSRRMKQSFISQLKLRIRTFRFRVAAAVLIPFIALVGAFTFIADRSGAFSSEKFAEITVPYGEQLQVMLQDGTSVQLNSGSRLQYPKSFGLFNRKVNLAGEAYFIVAKEKGRPFVVNLNEIQVKVTGTKFNAKAYPDDAKITVSIEEGSVDVLDNKNNTYPLTINQTALYDKNTGICTVNNTEDMTLHTAWRSKSLNFYRTPLKEILKVLERQYEVAFVVNDSSLLEYKFSISTSRVNAGEILMDLEKVSKIRFHLTGDGNYKVVSSETQMQAPPLV